MDPQTLSSRVLSTYGPKKEKGTRRIYQPFQKQTFASVNCSNSTAISANSSACSRLGRTYDLDPSVSQFRPQSETKEPPGNGSANNEVPRTKSFDRGFVVMNDEARGRGWFENRAKVPGAEARSKKELQLSSKGSSGLHTYGSAPDLQTYIRSLETMVDKFNTIVLETDPENILPVFEKLRFVLSTANFAAVDLAKEPFVAKRGPSDSFSGDRVFSRLFQTVSHLRVTFLQFVESETPSEVDLRKRDLEVQADQVFQKLREGLKTLRLIVLALETSSVDLGLAELAVFSGDDLHASPAGFGTHLDLKEVKRRLGNYSPVSLDQIQVNPADRTTLVGVDHILSSIERHVILPLRWTVQVLRPVRTVALIGPPGVGKNTLVREILHRFRTGTGPEPGSGNSISTEAGAEAKVRETEAELFSIDAAELSVQTADSVLRHVLAVLETLTASAAHSSAVVLLQVRNAEFMLQSAEAGERFTAAINRFCDQWSRSETKSAADSDYRPNRRVLKRPRVAVFLLVNRFLQDRIPASGIQNVPTDLKLVSKTVRALRGLDKTYLVDLPTKNIRKEVARRALLETLGVPFTGKNQAKGWLDTEAEEALNRQEGTLSVLVEELAAVLNEVSTQLQLQQAVLSGSREIDFGEISDKSLNFLIFRLSDSEEQARQHLASVAADSSRTKKIDLVRKMLLDQKNAENSYISANEVMKEIKTQLNRDKDIVLDSLQKLETLISPSLFQKEFQKFKKFINNSKTRLQLVLQNWGSKLRTSSEQDRIENLENQANKLSEHLAQLTEKMEELDLLQLEPDSDQNLLQIRQKTEAVKSAKERLRNSLLHFENSLYRSHMKSKEALAVLRSKQDLKLQVENIVDNIESSENSVVKDVQGMSLENKAFENDMLVQSWTCQQAKKLFVVPGSVEPSANSMEDKAYRFLHSLFFVNVDERLINKTNEEAEIKKEEAVKGLLVATWFPLWSQKTQSRSEKNEIRTFQGMERRVSTFEELFFGDLNTLAELMVTTAIPLKKSNLPKVPEAITKKLGIKDVQNHKYLALLYKKNSNAGTSALETDISEIGLIDITTNPVSLDITLMEHIQCAVVCIVLETEILKEKQQNNQAISISKEEFLDKLYHTSENGLTWVDNDQKEVAHNIFKLFLKSELHIEFDESLSVADVLGIFFPEQKNGLHYSWFQHESNSQCFLKSAGYRDNRIVAPVCRIIFYALAFALRYKKQPWKSSGNRPVVKKLLDFLTGFGFTKTNTTVPMRTVVNQYKTAVFCAMFKGLLASNQTMLSFSQSKPNPQTSLSTQLDRLLQNSLYFFEDVRSTLKFASVTENMYIDARYQLMEYAGLKSGFAKSRTGIMREVLVETFLTEPQTKSFNPGASDPKHFPLSFLGVDSFLEALETSLQKTSGSSGSNDDILLQIKKSVLEEKNRLQGELKKQKILNFDGDIPAAMPLMPLVLPGSVRKQDILSSQVFSAGENFLQCGSKSWTQMDIRFKFLSWWAASEQKGENQQNLKAPVKFLSGFLHARSGEVFGDSLMNSVFLSVQDSESQVATVIQKHQEQLKALVEGLRKLSKYSLEDKEIEERFNGFKSSLKSVRCGHYLTEKDFSDVLKQILSSASNSKDVYIKQVADLVYRNYFAVDHQGSRFLGSYGSKQTVAKCFNQREASALREFLFSKDEGAGTALFDVASLKELHEKIDRLSETAFSDVLKYFFCTKVLYLLELQTQILARGGGSSLNSTDVSSFISISTAARFMTVQKIHRFFPNTDDPVEYEEKTGSDVQEDAQQKLRTSEWTLVNEKNITRKDLAKKSFQGLLMYRANFSQRDISMAVKRGVQDYLFHLFSLAKLPSVVEFERQRQNNGPWLPKPQKFVCTRTVLPFSLAYQDFVMRDSQSEKPSFGEGIGQRLRVDGEQCKLGNVDPQAWGEFVQELLLGSALSLDSRNGLFLSNPGVLQRMADTWAQFTKKISEDTRLQNRNGIVVQGRKNTEFFTNLLKKVQSGSRSVDNLKDVALKKKIIQRIHDSRGLLIYGLLRSIALQLTKTSSTVDMFDYNQMLHFTLDGIGT